MLLPSILLCISRPNYDISRLAKTSDYINSRSEFLTVGTTEIFTGICSLMVVYIYSYVYIKVEFVMGKRGKIGIGHGMFYSL